MAKNTDLITRVNYAPDYNDYYDLYEHYILSKHPDSESMHSVTDTFENFLFSSWSETFAIELRLPSDQLISVSICDPLIQGWSAVYTFYSPEHSARSLGNYSILKQIDLLSERSLEYLYLGYWIKDCQKMNYKSKFKPCEGFNDNQWIAVNE